MKINEIKSIIYNFTTNKDRPAKSIIRELNQKDRVVLKKILSQKEDLGQDEIDRLGARLEQLNISKGESKAHKPISHAIKNIFFKRVSTRTLLNLSRKLTPPPPEKATKRTPATDSSSSQSDPSDNQANLIKKADIRDILPQEILYKIVKEVPIKNEIDLTDCLSLMKTLWKPKDKNAPRIIGSIDAQLFANWLQSSNLPISNLIFSLYPNLAFQFTSINLPHSKVNQRKELAHCTKLMHLDLANAKDLSDDELENIIDKNPHLQTLNITNCYKLTEKRFNHLKKLKDLTTLSISCLTEKELKGLSGVKSLTSLHLAISISNEKNILPSIRTLQGLKTLILGNSKITNDTLKQISQLFPSLTNLDISYCPLITDEGMEYIGKLHSLTHLNLESCLNIGDTGLGHLKNLRKLTFLNLSHCKLVSDEGLKIIGTFKNLNALNLGFCFTITDKGIKSIQRLKYLKRLDLGYCNRITDVGFSHIKLFSLLEDLNLYYCNLTDNGLEHLKELKCLTSLNLKLTKFTEKGLNEFIKEWPFLMSLDLSYTEITDKEIKEIAKHKFLTSLSLSSCKITDKGLDDIIKMRFLAKLDLSSNKYIKDKSLKKIATMKSLTSLNVSFNKSITNRGIGYVKGMETKPKVKFLGCPKVTEYNDFSYSFD